nr:hypothetical protein [uncultured Rhodopila sp.]
MTLGITAYYIDLFSTPMASRSQADVMWRIKLLYEDVSADNLSKITSVLGVRLNEDHNPAHDFMAIGAHQQYFDGKGVSIETVRTELNGFPYTLTRIVIQMDGGECIKSQDIRQSFASDTDATTCGVDAQGPCAVTYRRVSNNSIPNPYVSFAFDHSSCVNKIDLKLVSPIPPGATTESRPKTGAAALPPYQAGR